MVALSEKKIITIVLSSQYCVIVEVAKNKHFAPTDINIKTFFLYKGVIK